MESARRDEAVPQQDEPLLLVTRRAAAPYFALTTSLMVSPPSGIGAVPFGVKVTSVGVEAQQPLAVSTGDGAQQASAVSAAETGAQQPVVAAAAATASAAEVSQHALDSCPALGVAEHTPVAGSVSSTRRAPSISPVSAATTDRTCSYPVSMRNVGARP